jgi:hypothetical protein
MRNGIFLAAKDADRYVDGKELMNLADMQIIVSPTSSLLLTHGESNALGVFFQFSMGFW